MKYMSETDIKLDAILKKYNEGFFRMGLSHLADAGIRNFTPENIAEARETFNKLHNETTVDENGKKAINLMTPEGANQILDCAIELSAFDIWDIFGFATKRLILPYMSKGDALL